jgi:hypothetical protein
MTDVPYHSHSIDRSVEALRALGWVVVTSCIDIPPWTCVVHTYERVILVHAFKAFAAADLLLKIRDMEPELRELGGVPEGWHQYDVRFRCDEKWRWARERRPAEVQDEAAQHRACCTAVASLLDQGYTFSDEIQPHPNPAADERIRRSAEVPGG